MMPIQGTVLLQTTSKRRQTTLISIGRCCNGYNICIITKGRYSTTAKTGSHPEKKLCICCEQIKFLRNTANIIVCIFLSYIQGGVGYTLLGMSAANRDARKEMNKCQLCQRGTTELTSQPS